MRDEMTMKIEKGIPVMFTPKQAAQILNVSRSQVYVLLKQGDLESVSIRGCRRVSEDQLVRYIRFLES